MAFQETLPPLDFPRAVEVHHLPYEFGMAQFRAAERALDERLTWQEFAWADTEPAPLITLDDEAYAVPRGAGAASVS